MASGSAGVVVEFSGLTKRFGSLTAVDDLSFTVAPGQVTGFLGPERRRQDHDAADAARPGPADVRHRDHRRSRVRRPRPPARGRRRRARGDRRAPRAVRPRPPAHHRRRRRHPRQPGRRAARDDRHPGVRAQAGRRLLDRDAAAARARAVAARRPAAAGPRRAGQRPRPRGHPLAARLPAPPLPRPGQDRAGLQPPAAGGRADRRRRRHHLQRNAWSSRARWPTSAEEPARVVRTSDPAASPCSGPRARRREFRARRGRHPVRALDRPAGDRRRRAAAGLPVWELRRREADLEALFFELTEGRNRNLGEAV